MRFCEWKGSAVENSLRRRENEAASNPSTMCKSKVLTAINTYRNFQNKNPNPLVEERTSVPGLPADQGSRGAPVIFPSCWQSAWLQGHIEGVTLPLLQKVHHMCPLSFFAWSHTCATFLLSGCRLYEWTINDQTFLLVCSFCSLSYSLGSTIF